MNNMEINLMIGIISFFTGGIIGQLVQKQEFIIDFIKAYQYNELKEENKKLKESIKIIESSEK